MNWRIVAAIVLITWHVSGEEPAKADAVMIA
jgi:hypothetical protein